MLMRVLGICVIFIATSIAWMTLGASVQFRSSTGDKQIREEVQSLWGTELHQKAPTVDCTWVVEVQDEKYVEREVPLKPGEKPADGVKKTEMVKQTFMKKVDERAIEELDSTRIRADIDMDYRRRGLLWYNTYNLDFTAAYTWTYNGETPGLCKISFMFPSDRSVFDNFVFRSNGTDLKTFDVANNTVTFEQEAKPGQKNTIDIAYKTRGMDQWKYDFRNMNSIGYSARGKDHGEYTSSYMNRERESGSVSRVRNFDMEVSTKFRNIDFPTGTISPSEKTHTPDGWRLDWKYKSLISGFEIGLSMPEKMNPGPLVSQITLFAPVSLLFFFIVIFVICVLRNIDLHPINYIFIAAAFFSFHILMAYLVDHIDIGPAFAIAATVSILLVVSYLRLAVGWKFSIVQAGLSQVVYLIAFSYAHFLKGFTGLSITIISILTLFVLMQITGRINWTEKLRRPEKAKEQPPLP